MTIRSLYTIAFILSFSLCPWSVVHGQRDVSHRDFPLVDSLNTGKPFKLIPDEDTTVIKKGYSFISRSDGKFYQEHLERYIRDTLGFGSVDFDSIRYRDDIDSLCFYLPDTMFCTFISIAPVDGWELLDMPGTPPDDAADSISRSGYTLWTGLSGGLNQKIEMLKEGILQFDQETGASAKVYQVVRPLQQSESNPYWQWGLESASNGAFSDRNNDVLWYNMYNMNPGGEVIDDASVSFGSSDEPHYVPGAIDSFVERHWHYVPIGGSIYRPESWIIDQRHPETYSILNFCVKEFHLKEILGLDSYFNVTFGTADATLNLTNPVSNKGLQLYADPASNNAQLVPLGAMTNPQFYLNSWYATQVNRLAIATLQDAPNTILGVQAGGSNNVGGVAIGDGLLFEDGELSAVATSDSIAFSEDSICIIVMGDEICVELDSFYFTDTSVCFIDMLDTTCYPFNVEGAHFYYDDWVFTGNRTATIASGNTLTFAEAGVPFLKMYTTGDSTVAVKKFKFSGQLLDKDGDPGSGNQVLASTISGVNWTSLASIFSVRLNELNGANGSNVIDNSAHTQEWSWNGIGSETGFLLTSNSTSASGNLQRLFRVALSGANASSNQNTYAGHFSNTHTGTGSGNYGIYSEATGGTSNYAVFGTTDTGFGLYGDASSSGIGVRGGSSSGTGVYAFSDSGTAIYGQSQTGTPLDLSMQHTANNDVRSVAILRRSVTGGAGAAGIGTQLEFETETTTGQATANKIISKWTTATHASRTSQMTITGVGNATTNDIMYLEGDKRVRLNGRLQRKMGANVASANDLTLGYDGDVFHITGTTQINAITTTDWQAGSQVTLIFDASVTVKDNTSGGGSTAVMQLAGSADFGATAKDVLVLLYDGTEWLEVSRSAN